MAVFHDRFSYVQITPPSFMKIQDVSAPVLFRTAFYIHYNVIGSVLKQRLAWPHRRLSSQGAINAAKPLVLNMARLTHGVAAGAF